MALLSSQSKLFAIFNLTYHFVFLVIPNAFPWLVVLKLPTKIFTVFRHIIGSRVKFVLFKAAPIDVAILIMQDSLVGFAQSVDKSSFIIISSVWVVYILQRAISYWLSVYDLTTKSAYGLAFGILEGRD